MLAAAQGGRCDEMFLGTDIGWVDVMEYHDADGSCAISMQELGNVCKTHYQACLSFLQNSHTTKGAPHDPPTTIHALPKPPPQRS